MSPSIPLTADAPYRKQLERNPTMNTQTVNRGGRPRKAFDAVQFLKIADHDSFGGRDDWDTMEQETAALRDRFSRVSLRDFD